ncbi:ELWxxDGT repeat protein [Lacipirellula sp.]|uniref:ELWxxDGT repeat protein n=1 Tax=Lacipirellula sp. TaxID=2691419 RepID=UPI003D0A4204
MHHRRSRRAAHANSPLCTNDRLRLETLEPRQVLSGVAELLLDVNTNPLSIGARPQQYVVANDYAYFFTANVTRNELWRTDGTEAGTLHLRDFYGGGELTNVNGVVYFSARGVVGDSELWRSDGTVDGTWLVKEIHRYGSASPTSLANVDGTLYFNANDGLNGSELWKSDGTAEGTAIVADLLPGSVGSGARPTFNLNGTLLFVASNAAGLQSLYVHDDSSSQPVLLETFTYASASSSFANFTQVGSTAYFTVDQGAYGIDLWKTDGTADGTQRVDGVPSVETSGASYARRLANVNGTLFFVANRVGLDGRELWKTDGTAAGTLLVKDIRPGTLPSNPSYLVNFNGTLYFTAEDGVSGNELWRSDGTAAGTLLAHDIVAGGSSSAPAHLAVVGDTLYFRAQNAANGAELWKKTGAAAPALVRDIAVGSNSSGLSTLTNFNGKLLFNASPTQDAAFDAEPWISDGTTAGTTLVKDVLHATASGYPSVTVEVNGVHYFLANDGAHGVELWRTNGRTAGTSLVKDIRPGSLSAFSTNSVLKFANVNGKLYFPANNGSNGVELWVSDGTAAGTKLVKDINSGSASSSPAQLTNVGGIIYFSANDGVTGNELWRSNGTAAGTQLVANLQPSAISSTPENLVTVDGTLYFTADAPSLGTQLWKIPAGSSAPVRVTNAANAAVNSPNIPLTVVDDKIFFVMRVETTGDELWVADSTGARSVVDLDPNSVFSSPSNTINVNGVFYFDGVSTAQGRELWRSDGTTAGTYLVRDLAPREASSYPSHFVNVNGTLFFASTVGSYGTELWKSDGTAAGTTLAHDILPGPLSSSPLGTTQWEQFIVIDDWLYFTARIDYATAQIGIFRVDDSTPQAILLTDAYTLSLGIPGNQGFSNLNGDLAFNSADDYGYNLEMYVLRQSAIDQSGDYTSDGAVDGADFLAWQRSYNTRVEPFGSGADGTGNGVVNAFDLDVWKGNFGTQLAATEIAAVTAPSVAEPLAALDAAFESNDITFAPLAVAAPPARPERTDAAFSPRLSLGAAAITLRQATSVDSIARTPHPSDHRPRAADQYAAPASKRSPFNSQVSTPRTSPLQRPVDAAKGPLSAELATEFSEPHDASPPPL